VLTELLKPGPSDKGYGVELPFSESWTNSSWTATIDGVTLTEQPEVLARQGLAANVPLILGSAHNAGTSIASECSTCRKYLHMTMRERQYMKWVDDNFPKPWSEQLLKIYSVDRDKPFWAAAKALTDYVFKCPTDRAAQFLTQPGGSANVFVYNFDVNPVGPYARPEDAYGGNGDPCEAGSQGVALGSDLAFFLNEHHSLSTQYEKDLSSEMSQYFRNFAWSGDPNIFPDWIHQRRVELTRWPAFENQTHQKLWIGMPSAGNITVRNITKGVSCDLWNAYWKAGEPIPGMSATVDATFPHVYI
jgi:carboxylesterase type B